MKANEFINQLDDARIVEAIRIAEGKTSGEIRVFVTHKEVDHPILAAERHFTRLKMDRTAQRNAVLIFVAPASRKFAIIGDAGIHTHCGPTFWTSVAEQMHEHFKQSAWTEGVVHAIQKSGDLLMQHFPRTPDDVNELPDKVERD